MFAPEKPHRHHRAGALRYRHQNVDRRYKSSPSPPPAPDPTAVANAQSAANAEAIQKSAEVNQINQVTPYGTQTFTGTIGQPDRTVTTSLNPVDQQTLDLQRQLAQELTQKGQTVVGQIPTTAFDVNSAPKMINPDATNLQQVQDAVYARNTQYLDPQFANAQHDLDVSLANQGIPVGSEAWTRAQNQLANQKQQAYSDARDAAIQAGNAAQSQQFGLAQAAHQQGLSDELLSYQEPVNQLAQLLSGAPALQSPNFGPVAQYQQAPADVTGAFGLSQAAKNAGYQGQVNAATSGNSALAGLAGAGLTAAAIF